MPVTHVYVLHTGGTIGSHCEPLVPMSCSVFTDLVKNIPNMSNGEVGGTSIKYTIECLIPLLDSSNMNPSDWITITKKILEKYSEYDGFVILHGTDTMAYTASALSFLLPGLSKPVICTGSQLPLSYTLNDAYANLIGAIILAGNTTLIPGTSTRRIPESCLYFNSVLLRGNRSVKVNASRFAAFDSPNYPVLATVGTKNIVNIRNILPMPNSSVSLDNVDNRTSVCTNLDLILGWLERNAVIEIGLYPGINGSTVRAVINTDTPSVKGVVIQAFGAGNGPSEQDFRDALDEANNDDKVLMINTQCVMGSADIDAYETGLGSVGGISAYDMTSESSLAKLVYLFGIGTTVANVKIRMKENMVGEITPPSTE